MRRERTCNIPQKKLWHKVPAVRPNNFKNPRHRPLSIAGQYKVAPRRDRTHAQSCSLNTCAQKKKSRPSEHTKNKRTYRQCRQYEGAPVAWVSFFALDRLRGCSRSCCTRQDNFVTKVNQCCLHVPVHQHVAPARRSGDFFWCLKRAKVLISSSCQNVLRTMR